MRLLRKTIALLVLIGLLMSSLAPMIGVVSAQSGIIITPVDPLTFQPQDTFQILGNGDIAFNVTNTRADKITVSVYSMFHSLESQGMKVNAMHEWKELPYNVSVPIYDVRTVTESTYNNATGLYENVTSNETYVSAYVEETRYKWDWKRMNMFLIDGKSTQPKSDGIVIGKGETKTFMYEVEKKPELNAPTIKFDIVVEGTDELGATFTEVLDPWVLGYWSERAPLQINNTGCATAFEYHQVYVNLTYDSDMNTSFADLRFVNDTAGAEVPYWIEDKVDGQWCEVWFNVTYLAASAWTNSTYLYYNNPEATSASDGDATFGFFDHFEGSSLDSKWSQVNVNGDTTVTDSVVTLTGTLNKWNTWRAKNVDKTSVPFILECYAKFGIEEGNPTEMIGTSDVSTGISYAGDWMAIDYETSKYYVSGNDDTYSHEDRTTSLLAWTRVGMHIYSGAVDFYENGTLTKHKTTDIPDAPMWVFMGSAQTAGVTSIDYIFIRKYASPEPDVVVGAEELSTMNITSWYNDKTQDNSTSITINETEVVFFNATANKDVDTWTWLKDGVDQNNNNDTINLSWDYYDDGVKTVKVTASNDTYGNDSAMWIVTVLGTDIFKITAKNEDTDASISTFTTVLNAVEKSTGASEIKYNTTGLSPSTEYELIASATGFPERKFYITTPGTPPTSQDVVVYLLATADGAYIRVHVSDSAGYAVTDAKVTAKKDSAIVEEVKTDASGVGRLFLDPTTQYQIEVAKAGYTTVVYMITPTSSDYYITFGGVQPIVVPVSDVTWKLKPEYTSIKNETIYFTFNTSSPKGAIQYWGMKIENETDTLFDQTWTNATGGKMSASIDLTNYSSSDKIYVTVKVKESGEVVKTEVRTYHVYVYVEPGVTSLTKLLQNLGDKLDDFTKVFVSLLMTLFLIGIIMKYVPAGVFGGGILALIFLGFFTYLGWFPWILMLLMGATAIGLYAFMGGR